jgi:type I restriction-modification system DNA methylase subunit
MGWGDRLCVMNLFLHGIGGDDSPIVVGDALISDPGERFEFVLTNPPFGKKSSITIFNGERKVRQTSPIVVGDALISDPGERFEFVLTNPPFGKKSSITIFNGERKVRQTKNLSYMRGRIFGQLLQINNLISFNT